MENSVLTYANIAALTGLSHENLRGRLSQGRMPEPDGRLGATPYWLPQTIEAWAPGGVVPRLPRVDRGVRRGPQARTLARQAQAA